jgi:hypothetical protein
VTPHAGDTDNVFLYAAASSFDPEPQENCPSPTLHQAGRAIGGCLSQGWGQYVAKLPSFNLIIGKNKLILLP